MDARRVSILLGLFLGTGLCSVNASAAPPAKEATFSQVESLLKAHCVQCHGAERQEGKLRLDTREAMLRGGLNGTALVPGQSAKSLLLKRVQGEGGMSRMPLGFAPLTPKQTELLANWIDKGAAWGNTKSPKKHWAYLRPVRPNPPKVVQKAFVRNPIDAFILARLEKSGLKPSPEAARVTLIRRVSLDLIGLPPTVEEVVAFEKDKSPNAYEKVVDRLLASPRYGERWARPWLDLARYADTNGYEKDERRSIWPFRDWVISAYNQDMPFTQFTIEQIAGDMLPNATLSQKVATGFHRNTMLNEEGGVDKEEQRWLTLIDRVGTTGSVWLGATISCAQCHNHKYDPITQKEFYQFLSFFDRADEPRLDVAPVEQLTLREKLRTEIADFEKQVQAENAKGANTNKVQVNAWTEEINKRNKQISDLNIPTTLVIQEKPATTKVTTFLRVKGAFLTKGEAVAGGVPAVLNPLRDREPNRLSLAKWLVSDENPLTARVQVNRLWEQLFGRGIVETSDDFGTQGSPPTHPQLLDWLATEFMRNGWSQKRILKTMVMSATYRQTSRVTPERLAKDPYNKLLSRGARFRLEAEMLRDTALSAAGLLSTKIGGPGVFPLQPDGVWVIPYNGDQWKTSPGEDRYRRGIYTFWRRTSPYPAFLTFDATSREFCTTRRIRTTTPLQALTTLNDAAFFDAARGLARRIMKEKGEDTASGLNYAFRLCISRKPSTKELERLNRLYQKQLARYQNDLTAALKVTGEMKVLPETPRLAALTITANVLLNLDETLNKE